MPVVVHSCVYFSVECDEWNKSMVEFPKKSHHFSQSGCMHVARMTTIVPNTMLRLGIIALLFLVGCTSKPTPPSAIEEVLVESPSGTLLTFTALTIGTLSSSADRTTVTAGRKFQIDGELTTPCKIGDIVHIDLRHRVGPDKWSSIANAVTKIKFVKDGKGQFSTDFYVSDIGDRDCRLNVELYTTAMDTRTDAGAVEIRLSTAAR